MNVWKKDADNYLLWDVVLKEGPFDGDTGCIDTLPPMMYVCWCPRCGDHVAWNFEPFKGGECYRKATVNSDTKTAVYIYGGAGNDTEEEITVMQHLEPIAA